jgi:hypothetical protein
MTQLMKCELKCSQGIAGKHRAMMPEGGRRTPGQLSVISADSLSTHNHTAHNHTASQVDA